MNADHSSLEWAKLSPTANYPGKGLVDWGIGATEELGGCVLFDPGCGVSLRARATIIQQKTGQPVPFEITEPTRDALAVWLKARGRRNDDWLFPSRSRPGDHVSTRQYARLVGKWVSMIELEPGRTVRIAFAERRWR